MGIFANSEDPDEMPQIIVFHKVKIKSILKDRNTIIF